MPRLAAPEEPTTMPQDAAWEPSRGRSGSDAAVSVPWILRGVLLLLGGCCVALLGSGVLFGVLVLG
jgi:hypothetical protein